MMDNVMIKINGSHSIRHSRPLMNGPISPLHPMVVPRNQVMDPMAAVHSQGMVPMAAAHNHGMVPMAAPHNHGMVPMAAPHNHGMVPMAAPRTQGMVTAQQGTDPGLYDHLRAASVTSNSNNSE